MGRLDGARLELERRECLQPGQDAAGQQCGDKKEGAPKQAQRKALPQAGRRKYRRARILCVSVKGSAKTGGAFSGRRRG